MITLFKNGMIWEQDHFCKKDMVVEDERITVIGVVPEGFVCDKFLMWKENICFQELLIVMHMLRW